MQGAGPGPADATRRRRAWRSSDHPDVRRMLMHAEGVRRGACARWSCTPRSVQDASRSRAATASPRRRRRRRRSTTCCCRSSRATARRRCTSCSRSRCRPSAARATCEDYPIEQYIRDQKIDSLYEGTTHIQALDLFFRKIGRDRGATLQALLGQIKATVDELPADLGAEKAALGAALADVQGIVGAMLGKLGQSVYHVGLQGNRILFALAELVIGWRLAVSAQVALGKAVAASTAEEKRVLSRQAGDGAVVRQERAAGHRARAEADRGERSGSDGAARRQLVSRARGARAMNLPEYNAFAEQLRRNLEADPRVVGLIACGSMAQLDTRPDDWSDHDFLVVVQPGLQEGFREHLGWLPDADRVAYRFRETAHGLKLLYESGHMLEFAVFDPDELRVGRFNRFRVLLDRADLQRRMEEIAATTREARRAEAPSDAFAIGQVLTGVLVAYGRWVRGERLSARSFLINMVVPNLVQLFRKYGTAAGGTGTTDNLDPLRRSGIRPRRRGRGAQRGDRAAAAPGGLRSARAGAARAGGPDAGVPGGGARGRAPAGRGVAARAGGHAPARDGAAGAMRSRPRACGSWCRWRALLRQRRLTPNGSPQSGAPC